MIWSVLPLLAGWTPRVILSGSMEPRIHVGDIVVTRTVPGTTVTKGQVITVKDPDHPEKTRTHRVLRRAADGTIVTKGDANPQADSSHISNHDVLGLGVVRVPFVGRPAFWLAEQNWLALGATSLFLGWCLVTVLPTSRRSEDTPGDDEGRPGPGSGTPRNPLPRRVAATLGVAAVVVGAAAGPSDAAFKLAAANPVSTLNAATNFWDYKTEVLGDTPYLYWRLDETSGTSIADAGTGGRTGTMAGSVTRSQTGALTSETPNRAISSTTGSISTTGAAVSGPATFSVEAWIKTTSSAGGRILGFGDKSGTTTSTTLDRQLYLGVNGKVYFGIGSAKTIVASSATVNNGAWHHVVGTYTSGSNGMKLYVDGSLQGSATAIVQSFAGYWKAFNEHLTGWTSNPTSDYFVGTLDELAVYTAVLTPTEITSHYTNATG